MRACRLVCAVLTVGLVTAPLYAQKPRDAQKEIRLNKTATGFRFTVHQQNPPTTSEPDFNGDALADKQVFLATLPVTVTYQFLNPLALRVSIKTKLIDSPTKDVLDKLASALAALPGLVGLPKENDSTEKSLGLDVERQKAPPAAKGCDLLPQLLQVKLKELQETLKKTIDVEKQYGVWKKKIADGFATATNGSQAIEAGAAAIETDRASVGVTIEQAKSAIAAMNKIMSDTAYDACAWQLAVTTQVLGVYEGKIEQLGRLAESLSALAKQLRTQFGDSNKWIGRAFIVATDLEPSTVSDVEVAVSASDLSVINENGNVSLKEDPKASTVSFLIREKVGWTVESSVGATFAQLTRPKYGTSTNAAGETIVQKAKDERALITPSVMVNITPQNKSGVVPIFQFGVSIATSAPALLIGGGWKIPGVQSGRLAFSGGAVLGWVKDLDKLQVNDVVTGTKELEADLRFDPMPRFGWYLNIQYKFGK